MLLVAMPPLVAMPLFLVGLREEAVPGKLRGRGRRRRGGGSVAAQHPGGEGHAAALAEPV